MARDREMYPPSRRKFFACASSLGKTCFIYTTLVKYRRKICINVTRTRRKDSNRLSRKVKRILIEILEYSGVNRAEIRIDRYTANNDDEFANKIAVQSARAGGITRIPFR